MKINHLILSLLLLTNILFSDDEIILPELGDRVSGAVSSSQEKAIGEMFL